MCVCVCVWVVSEEVCEDKWMCEDGDKWVWVWVVSEEVCEDKWMCEDGDKIYRRKLISGYDVILQIPPEILEQKYIWR